MNVEARGGRGGREACAHGVFDIRTGVMYSETACSSLDLTLNDTDSLHRHCMSVPDGM